jgi:hypothetical protein
MLHLAKPASELSLWTQTFLTKLVSDLHQDINPHVANLQIQCLIKDPLAAESHLLIHRARVLSDLVKDYIESPLPQIWRGIVSVKDHIYVGLVGLHPSEAVIQQRVANHLAVSAGPDLKITNGIFLTVFFISYDGDAGLVGKLTASLEVFIWSAVQKSVPLDFNCNKDELKLFWVLQSSYCLIDPNHIRLIVPFSEIMFGVEFWNIEIWIVRGTLKTVI